jgi:hypothetical protein
LRILGNGWCYPLAVAIFKAIKDIDERLGQC